MTRLKVLLRRPVSLMARVAGFGIASGLFRPVPKAAREGLAIDRSNNYVVRTPSMALQASSASASILKGEPITFTAHLF